LSSGDIPNDLMLLSDEKLVLEAREDNEHAFEILITRYKGCVLAKARTYFLIGADKEDIIQEGMIGLIKAIRDYRTDRQSGFKSFAELCITRQIITAIKTATRQKHIPLNSYISLYKSEGEGDNNSSRMLIEVIEGDSSGNPEEQILIRESYRGVDEKIYRLLSKFERTVLEYYLKGKSYIEISKVLGKSVKSIDNALQRIKRKLEKSYAEENRK